jgi:hypothetical protein
MAPSRLPHDDGRVSPHQSRRTATALSQGARRMIRANLYLSIYSTIALTVILLLVVFK